jgi:glyoxylase-like metal-dependent hydrolase (beta-lactamase superfamily II)
MSLKESYLLEGGGDRLLPATYTVFQIRFPDGWIMVDAGMDPEVAGDTTARFRSEHALVDKALLGARSIVVTHEHHDHVGGVVRSPALGALAPKTLLNRAQARTLQERPNVPLIRIDSTTAASYPLVDYELLLPIAPGVVLIRAPGHTPGSQMVFVRLASGRELLLIGDIAWHMDGVEQRRQKPDSISKDMGEDRVALQAELDWLHDVSTRTPITLVNGHDDRWLGKLIARGALVEGLDLTRP